MAYFARISLPFADFAACASWSGGDSVRSPFQLAKTIVTPRLPPGMSVDSTVSLVGTLSSHEAIHEFEFNLRFSSEVVKGTMENGENLAAQSFDIGKSRVMIGTEDDETIIQRLTWLELAKHQDPVSYLDDGLELTFRYVPPKSILDFHFVIAYNAVASDDYSEWFAVDIPHQQLLSLESTPLPSTS
jgi:hypothetical protein